MIAEGTSFFLTIALISHAILATMGMKNWKEFLNTSKVTLLSEWGQVAAYFVMINMNFGESISILVISVLLCIGSLSAVYERFKSGCK